MKKLIFALAIGVLLGFQFPVAFADPPMQPFYASAMKMKPEGRLGQIIKQENVATPVKGAQA